MNTLSIAHSGMAAAQQRMSAHAHNLANAGTEGYQRRSVVQTASPMGGTSAAWRRDDMKGPDLATDLVGQISAGHAFMANLAVFRTHDAMAGALLDAVA